MFETAKQLEVPPKKFTSWLLDRKYVYRDKKGKIMPYQKHVESGLFELRECLNDKTGWSGTQTMITPKGRETFRLLFPKERQLTGERNMKHKKRLKTPLDYWAFTVAFVLIGFLIGLYLWK